MKRTIRALFRVLRIAKHYDGSTSVELGPVKQDDDPEHVAFWEATPSGKCVLTYRPGYAVPFEPGAYYYVDCEPHAVLASEAWPFEDTPHAARWKVDEIRYRAGYRSKTEGSVQLSRVSRRHPFDDADPHLWNVSLEMSVVRGEVVDLFGPPDTLCSVTFTFAEANDHDERS